MFVSRNGPKPRMPVKASGARAEAAAVAAGAGDGEAALALAALLPHPLRLKYNVGKIIGTLCIFI